MTKRVIISLGIMLVIVSVSFADLEVKTKQKILPLEGFEVQDVAAQSKVMPIEDEALGLLLECKKTEQQGVTFFNVVLSDTTDKDRAITMLYAMNPVEGDRWRWLEGPAGDEVIDRSKSYLSRNGDFHPLSFNHDTVGACPNPVSRYPFAAITDGKRGVAIGIDMSHPAVYRLGFHGPSGRLYIAYDIGLAPEKPKAKVRFVTFTSDPKWGFRGALARYYEIFPEHFVCRVPSPKQGLKMPDGKISDVQGWEDFGFRFKRIHNDTKWDNANGMLTFHYIEPLSSWMAMSHDKLPKKDGLSAAKYKQLVFKAVEDEAKRQATKNDWYKALPTSVYGNVDGTPYYTVTDMPWCTGVLWGVNSMPGIKGEYTDFKNKWNAQLREKLYGNPEKNGVLHGAYIDSAEGFVGYLDFRRDHFAAATTPLTFDRKHRCPAIFRGLIAYEFIREIANDVHGMGKLTMSNQTPSELCWLAPLFDIMNTETDWCLNGKWTPMPVKDMFFRRAMCKSKPYGFLMNTDFDKFPHELMEKFMKRSLAFGMSPGCFSANAATRQYFTRPKLYNRDRELFKKYVPLCNLVAEAGWEPITMAKSSDDRVHVERFGESFLTILNDSRDKRTVKITLEGQVPDASRVLLSGETIQWKNKTTELTLDGDDVAVIELKYNNKQ